MPTSGVVDAALVDVVAALVVAVESEADVTVAAVTAVNVDAELLIFLLLSNHYFFLVFHKLKVITFLRGPRSNSVQSKRKKTQIQSPLLGY